MIVDKLLRQLVLAQRNTVVPIWSCRRSDALMSLRLGRQPPMSVTSAGEHRAFGISSASTVAISSNPPPPPSSTTSTTSATSGANSSSSTNPPSSSPPPPSKLLFMEMKYGLPHITVPLPSRNEPCVFTLKPVTNTIGDFLAMLQTEDAGIDRVVVRTTDGVRIASTTSIQTLIQNGDFDLVINDAPYRVQPPTQSLDPGFGEDFALLGEDQVKRVGNVRSLVGQLYEALNVEQHQAEQEQRLISEMEALKEELAPLERQREELALLAEKRTNYLTWLGLGMMSVQFGILARLTWWEYSWDIMEPVTYFVTYGTAMACYAYFVLTKQDYILPDVRDRQYLLTFHKRAKKDELDVSRYNALLDGLRSVEGELNRLRDPLHLRLPPSITAKYAATTERVRGVNMGGLIGAQINIGNLKNMLKSKLNG